MWCEKGITCTLTVHTCNILTFTIDKHVHSLYLKAWTDVPTHSDNLQTCTHTYHIHSNICFLIYCIHTLTYARSLYTGMHTQTEQHRGKYIYYLRAHTHLLIALWHTHSLLTGIRRNTYWFDWWSLVWHWDVYLQLLWINPHMCIDFTHYNWSSLTMMAPIGTEQYTAISIPCSNNCHLQLQ